MNQSAQLAQAPAAVAPRRRAALYPGNGAADFGGVADAISDADFARFRQLIYDAAGISFSPAKKSLLVGRLGKRLQHLGLRDFAEYYRCVTSGEVAGERQMLVDLLTTNETYFFREAKHFDFLAECALRRRAAGGRFRVWSAASSSGEEAYSAAMVLAECLAQADWEIVGSDISTKVLALAEQGLYPLARAEAIPAPYLKRYCLKGVREQEGRFLVKRDLRQRVRFVHANLLRPPVGLGRFDVIFLRNVMIYFDEPTKRRVVEGLLPHLSAEGFLIIGHSESLTGVTAKLRLAQPTIYQLAPRGAREL